MPWAPPGRFQRLLPAMTPPETGCRPPALPVFFSSVLACPRFHTHYDNVVTALGIDLVDVARIEAAVLRWGDRFLNRVYTPAEQAFCFRKGEMYRSLAARFAAKEAAMKALGTGWKRGVRWVDLEVTRNPGSAPQMALHGRSGELAAGRRFLVSLTHTDTQAIAVVIAESVQQPEA